MKDKIISEVNHKCAEQVKPECIISLNNVTKFKWDKLYIFGSWTTCKSIEETIGFNYQGDGVPDEYRRMIFVFNNRTVYEEDYKSLDYDNSSIEFHEIIDSLLQAKRPFLTPHNAVFISNKTKLEGSCKNCFCYILYLNNNK